jgi:DNA-binding MarR family transcriptional regulator
MYIQLIIDPRPFNVSETATDPRALPCLCAQTRRVDRLLNRIYDDALRPLGINVLQKSLLTNIGRHPGGIDFARLSDLLAMDRSTLTRNLTTLESSGYVHVSPGTRDRRKRVVELTDAGRAAVDASEPLWRGAQRRVVDTLGFARAQELTSLLASVELTIRELD